MAGTPFISQCKDVRGISVLHGVQPLVASLATELSMFLS